MDWKQKLQSASDTAKSGFNQKSEAVIQEHWPEIQRLIKEKVGPAALAASHDDQKMETLFKFVYAALPFPVHFVVKEDVFVKFCFAHREELLPST